MAAEEIRAFGSVAQLKVGQPNDYPTNASDTIDSLQLAFDEAVATGLVDRPIELVQRQVVAAS